MWNGKNKAVTFSYDDGVTQDERFIWMLNRHGLKATFNLNSGMLGENWRLEIGEKKHTISHVKFRPDEVREIYRGHEIAVHGVQHLYLPDLTDEEIVAEVENDRKALSELAGYEVVGMAYACREVDDERVRRVIREHTGVKYCRAVNSSFSFDLPEDLYCLHGTFHHFAASDEEIDRKIDEFLNAPDDGKKRLLYIWGHTYEFDLDPARWERIENVLERLSGRDDIFYGTNREVLLGE